MGAISQQVASRVLLGVAMHGEQLFEGNQDTNAAVSAVSRILYDVPGSIPRCCAVAYLWKQFQCREDGDVVSSRGTVSADLDSGLHFFKSVWADSCRALLSLTSPCLACTRT